MKNFLKICNLSAIVIIFAAACSKPGASQSEFLLGTLCTINLLDQAESGVYSAGFSRIREIENNMSVNLPNSYISRINNAAGIEPVEVPEDVFNIIEHALYYAEISNGAFDPAVGPLVSLWGIGTENPRLPSQKEIDFILTLVNWQDIELNREKRTVFLKKLGMALDLGAIAKGYAADEVTSIIRKTRIDRAIISLGGDIVTYGIKKDKSPWRIGIQDPTDKRGEYFGIVSGPAQAVATSGVYERYFVQNDIHYHHIFSPFTGYPVQNNLLSITVIANTAMDADALSTAIFVMGYEKGRALIDSIPDVEAVFVFEDLSVRKTKGVELSITDNRFRLQ